MLREVRFIKISSETNIPMPGYYVSDDAEVYTLNNPRVKDKLTRMMPRYDQTGKLYVEMRTAESERKSIPLEKLVASVFIANPNNYQKILHLNGNPDDCNASNLMWSKCNKCIYNRKFSSRSYAEQVCGMCSEHNKLSEVKEHHLFVAIQSIGLWKLNGAFRKIALMFLTGRSPKFMAQTLGITEQGVYKHIRNMRSLISDGLPAGKTSTITRTVLNKEQELIVAKINKLFILLANKESLQRLTIERSVQSLLVQLEIVAESGTMEQQYELDKFAQDCWSVLKFCNSSCNYELTPYNQ